MRNRKEKVLSRHRVPNELARSLEQDGCFNQNGYGPSIDHVLVCVSWTTSASVEFFLFHGRAILRYCQLHVEDRQVQPAKRMGDRSKRWPDRSAPCSNIRPSATSILLSRLIELLLSSLHVLSHPCHGVLLRRIHIASTCFAWAPTRSALWIELRYRC